ncbi:Eco57I restriction-modification methylase domain-containing protein [Spirosoma linguale]|uniref:site-specific DNA-methyltransferase (adenine-specific) n=1 Tax=Spirosoma linguale (strain ATCC 33905 / DSM 74 / LMG 10896 / Claus 1) TaxID=504472 RepID=D2QPB2_SPILD|nr:Eco57I restriction endonuclease [Spirosoma linguale DSM 74]
MTEYTLKTFLREPFSPTNQQTLLTNLFSDTLTVFTQPQLLIEAADNIRLAQQIGTVSLSDGRNLAIIDVAVTDAVQIARNRKGLRDMAAKYIDQNIVHGALVFFHSPTQADYRLTFIARYATFDLDALDLVKHETAPKRYSFLLSPKESNTTASRRLLMLIEKKGVISLKDLTEAFSVERLNREFFKQFKDVHFVNAWQYLAEHYRPLFLGNTAIPDKKEEKEKQEKPIRDFAKKMLGRIVFLHFLQKKGWMGCATEAKSWVDGDKQFMQNLFQQFPDKDQFYSRCLTKLFFETLNNPNRANAEFLVDGVNLCRIPYLNGGLFDKDMGSNGQTEPTTIDLPAAYFRDLLAFFDQYNFTIDENSPDDNEVGIDPEMLGHIFENLLEENRERGAFYTPRAIVQYMCQESLIQYLTHQLNLPAGHEAIATFIRKGERGDFKDKANIIATNARRIETLLDAVKICDPAIGSGAFPMGMLQEIFAAKLTLDWTLDRAETKKRIIQESIYGVDMDPGAVDIARLRFWLALVVDEDTPQPLPNLDYKIMQGNSLLESFENIRLDKIMQAEKVLYIVENGQIDIFGRVADPQIAMNFSDERKQQLQDLLRLYFDPEALKKRGLGKEVVKAQVESIVHEHLEYNFDLAERSLERQVGDLTAEISTIEKAMRNNPNEPKARRKQKEDQISRKQKSIDSLQKQLTAVRDSQQKLYTLDPANKPYFLWHLFFKDVFDQGGFDVVIGNPPYIQLQRMGKETDILEKAGYESFARTGDIYGLFYEQGINLLKKHGVLTYITSNKWMKAGYGQTLRQYFLTHSNPLKLIDFGGYQVFENATVDTNILIAQKEPYQNNTLTCVLNNGLDSLRNISDFFQHNAVPTSFSKPEVGWVILSSAEARIKAKIEEAGKPLKDWDVNIYRGILTGFNEAFIIDGKTKDDLISKSPKSAEIIRPLLRGQDIKRYKTEFSDKWIINSHNGIRHKVIPPVNINNYPELYNHLKNYEVELIKRLDKGDHWTNLRNCAYVLEFEEPKVVWQELSRSGNAFCYVEEPMYLNNTCFMLTGISSISLKYLTAILNHKISLFYLEQVYNKLDDTGWRWFKVAVEKIPIPCVSESFMTSLSTLVDVIQNKLKQKLDCTLEEKEIDRIVYSIYNLTELEIENIERRMTGYFK